jgi:Planctomycete cytochrome C/WD domain, G-beta repeat
MPMTSTRSIVLLAIVAFGLQLSAVCAAESPASPDFAKEVAPILAKYCAGCHNREDLEGDLSLESFADLQKGGSRGAVLVPGRADASLLIRALAGEVEPAMPPEGNARPKQHEIAVLRAWIDAGAKGPDGAESRYPELATPELASAPGVREYITSLAVSPDGKRLALGRYRHVDIVDIATRQVLATSPQLPGKVNSLAFSADGHSFVAASGIAGLYGVASVFRSEDAAISVQVKGHRDAIYDARLSPDGRLLATGSYDRHVNLWEVASGKLVRTLSGHNGAIFELAFSPDGSVLASASADGTVKIWSIATGERLDTLGQPEGEQSAVTISPDGDWIVAGGADRQVRMWRLVSRERPQVNPIEYSRTAHDSPIVDLAFSPDGSRLVTASEGRELMLWDTAKLTPVHNYEKQPDVVTGIAFEPAGAGFYVARIDGSWQHYEIATPNNGGVAVVETLTTDSAVTPLPEPPRFEGAEHEPNDSMTAANEITANAAVRGVISGAGASGKPDVDLFRFQARKGQQCVLEINAARQKSPLDSKLTILDSEGNPVPRMLLQAVRESYFTFRGHNSTDLTDFRLHGWQDMELNEYLYADGEVVKLWLYPRGPDSGFLVYPGIGGDRYTYFGTTAITHALNEPCYIVEPHPMGTELIPNGLPQYILYYENDDDGWRRLGADSQIVFVAPADGNYLVRVSDVRDFGGDEYRYELIVRARRPDFQIKVDAADLAINAGSGKEIAFTAARMDDFDGEIHIDIEGLPPRFHVSTPLTIQAGQTTAYAAITADPDAPAPTAENAKLAIFTAWAEVDGQRVVKDATSLGELKLAEKPKVLSQVIAPSDGAKASELFISPGQTISAIVRVERNGFDGEITFGLEFAGRNLPHGVYVDNIGLNGMTLLAGESQREFFITAAKWVPETTRPFHLRAEVEGNQTSWPVTLHVRKRQDTQATTLDNVATSANEK